MGSRVSDIRDRVMSEESDEARPWSNVVDEVSFQNWRIHFIEMKVWLYPWTI